MKNFSSVSGKKLTKVKKDLARLTHHAEVHILGNVENKHQMQKQFNESYCFLLSLNIKQGKRRRNKKAYNMKTYI